MVCERCRNEIANTSVVCPVCGTTTSGAQAERRAPGEYGQGLREQSSLPVPPPAARQGLLPAQPPGYASSYNAMLLYPQSSIGTPVVNGIVVSNRNDNGLVMEIIFSLFGIFGIGWLVMGETITGIALLLCSILIYWPIMILGTIFTDGLALICLGPLAIGAIILNILLLNATMKRKATRFFVPQPPVVP